MEVSPNALRQAASQAYTKAQKMREEVEQDGGLDPVKKYEFLVTLRLTEAQSLNTLVLLSEQGKRR